MRFLTINCLVHRTRCKPSLVSIGALKRLLTLTAIAFIIWIGTTPTAWGQYIWERTYTFTGWGGLPDSVMLGHSVSGAGDVNNDGYADLIVGAPGRGVFEDSSAGWARVYSGQGGGLLWTFTGEAIGDEFGYSVSGAGDVNNDGYDDLIVGATRAGDSESGRAYVYSGQTGALLWTFTGETTGDHFGTSVSGAGDVNNDGYDDLIVGALANDAGGNSAGRAYVYSGQTGGLLWTFTGAADYSRLGASVSGAGDVNHDGYADLIVGVPGRLGFQIGKANVYSGQTSGLLWTFIAGADGDLFGWSVAGVGDVNDNGFADLIVGAPYNDAGGSNAGRAYVYSGMSGDLLCTYDGHAEGDKFGRSVSGAGDVNNDGYDEVIIGAPFNNSRVDSAGRADVYACVGEEPYLCGDCTGDDVINVGDVVFLVSYLYKSGPAPAPECVGDVNHEGIVNVGDIVYLVSYLYKGGPAPDPNCCAPSLAAQ